MTPSPGKSLYASLNDWEISPDRVVALDCEMVGVGDDGVRSILARVSIVDWHGYVLMDTFVKPTETVTNYRTFVSGVRPHNLDSPDAMDFQICRSIVQIWLKDKILVGHGLSNDLKVLQLTHHWYHLRDSAKYGPFLRADHRSRRLKELAAEAGMDIQRDGAEHCSIEDAQAVMHLYRLHQAEWDYTVWSQRNAALKSKLCDLPAIKDLSI